MSTSEISNENIIMASFADMPEEVRKAFEERKKAREEKRCRNFLHAMLKILMALSRKSRSLFFL
jgi:hypothetical protein